MQTIECLVSCVKVQSKPEFIMSASCPHSFVPGHSLILQFFSAEVLAVSSPIPKQIFALQRKKRIIHIVDDSHSNRTLVHSFAYLPFIWDSVVFLVFAINKVKPSNFA